MGHKMAAVGKKIIIKQAINELQLSCLCLRLSFGGHHIFRKYSKCSLVNKKPKIQGDIQNGPRNGPQMPVVGVK